MPYMEDSLSLKLHKVLKIMHKATVIGNTYCGIPIMKSPLDSWMYREIIHRTRPDVIVEIGSKWGGSALMLQHVFDILGQGRVISIDINQSIIHEIPRKHPNITFLEGDALELHDEVDARIARHEKVMIIEDSAHTYALTSAILKKYSHMIKSGYYFIIEDTIMNHGLVRTPEKDPYKAVEDFVQKDPTFTIDRDMERFLITYNPKGYLRKL
jgi:cephalosporin hydroxylase